MIIATLALLCASRAAALNGRTPQSPPGAESLWSHLPPPPLMKGIGNARLKITTRSPLAQAYFNQGLRLLHCFWY